MAREVQHGDFSVGVFEGTEEPAMVPALKIDLRFSAKEPFGSVDSTLRLAET
jgi:hypothetical protein